MAEYAHPELLVDTEWLAQHLDDPTVRVVDCDSPAVYSRAHIPGSLNLSHPLLPEPQHYLKDPDDPLHVLPPDKFARVMGELGIGDDTLVVAYDDYKGRYATRLWWALALYGHANVKVLNGGWSEWLAEGRPVTNAAVEYPQATFTPASAPEQLATCDYLLGCVGNPDAVILDVRSDEEWTGEDDRDNERSGHIPGAVHLEWEHFVDERHLFKPADELQAMLAAAGVKPEAEVITH